MCTNFLKKINHFLFRHCWMLLVECWVYRVVVAYDDEILKSIWTNQWQLICSSIPVYSMLYVMLLLYSMYSAYSVVHVGVCRCMWVCLIGVCIVTKIKSFVRSFVRLKIRLFVRLKFRWFDAFVHVMYSFRMSLPNFTIVQSNQAMRFTRYFVYASESVLFCVKIANWNLIINVVCVITNL